MSWVDDRIRNASVDVGVVGAGVVGAGAGGWIGCGWGGSIGTGPGTSRSGDSQATSKRIIQPFYPTRGPPSTSAGAPLGCHRGGRRGPQRGRPLPTWNRSNPSIDATTTPVGSRLRTSTD